MPDGGGSSLLWRTVARLLTLGARLIAIWSTRLSMAAQRVLARAVDREDQMEPARPRLPWDKGEVEPPAHWLERLRRSRVPLRWIHHRTPERTPDDDAAPTQEDLLPTEHSTAEPTNGARIRRGAAGISASPPPATATDDGATGAG
jgi:hypothetical protein